MIDWQKCILGSSNVSNNGLGIASDCNYELNVLQDSIDAKTLFYLRKILADAVLMNDKIYQKYQETVDNLPEPPRLPELFESNTILDTDFLTSSLPMSMDIDKLYDLYTNNFYSNDREAIDCAMHDIALYNVPFGLSKDEFIIHLKKAFHDSKFIKKFLQNINLDGMYFGQVKAWIQNNCTDVPVPSRRDLTGNIQVLYRWIVELSSGKYLVDRPNYSERIYRVR